MNSEITKYKMKLKKGDLVMVIAGKDKGKQGTINEVITKENRVVVEGVNQVKRHMKASQTNPQGGITLKLLPVHASNVMIVDPKSGKPSRIGKKKTKDGFVRFAKNSGTEITTTYIKNTGGEGKLDPKPAAPKAKAEKSAKAAK